VIEMSTCDVCGEEIKYQNLGDGDVYSCCPICQWHSEGEGDSQIILNPTKEQIISQKKMLNELYDLVYHLHFAPVFSKIPKGMMVDHNGNIKPIQLDEVLDKIRKVKDSMIMEVDEQ
tara:strand:+ start:4466 stop:4816 length:351 start_codon:yes stop_codon:yes gene_type:complete